jgi:hypothetical protein
MSVSKLVVSCTPFERYARQPSQVGIDLSSIGFQNYFGNTNIGPVVSSGSVTLAPLATSSLSLTGRLIPQTQQSGLFDISTIFNNFLHGLDSNVFVHGDNAGPQDVCVVDCSMNSYVDADRSVRPHG